MILDGKHGFIDENGNEVIPTIYDYADPFEKGKAKVKKDTKEFFIDNVGNCIEGCN